MASRTVWPNYAGLRRWSRARSTGTMVAVFDGDAAGMDTDGGRWTMMCDTHGCVIAVETLRQALSMASAPEYWCDVDGGCTGEPPQ